MQTTFLQPQEAQYIRLPRSGSRDPIFGLSRSTWNNLILPTVQNRHQPPIKSVSLRKNGAIRGTRLIVIESALAFFNRLEAEQNLPAGPESHQALETNFEAQCLDSETKSLNPHDFIQATTQSHPRVA
ncbi:MAG: hypothetical protein ACOYM3_23800 [Terrimicrobiaceae bacterium]